MQTQWTKPTGPLTRAQFRTMRPYTGGDFWNPWKVYDAAFRLSDVDVVYPYYIGTGLWVDLTLRFTDGHVSTHRFYS